MANVYDPGRSVFDQYASPLYIMAKAAGPACNLDCRYCYYTEKNHLFSGERSKTMTDETLADFVRSYIEAQTTQEVLFTWHGGEPMLRPLEFYKKAVKLQQYYGRGLHIDNSIQTNGTLLTDEWCRFLHDQGWLVGLSIDGPEHLHDLYRRDHQGRPTHAQVMRAVEMLDRYQVQWNAMAVVHRATAAEPDAFYQFFKDIGCHYLQFAPIVERTKTHADGRHLASGGDTADLAVTPESVTPEMWGHFLCTLFDRWVRTDVGEYFVQIFDATLACWAGVPPGVCVFAPTCGHAGVMEHNGDVYACDHYVFPEYKLGNIRTHSFVEMMYGERQREFGLAKHSSLPQQCRDCRYLFACHGECPKNRFASTAAGEPGLNYLCAGYQRYFEHTAPYMRRMLQLLNQDRAPAEIMKELESNGNCTAEP